MYIRMPENTLVLQAKNKPFFFTFGKILVVFQTECNLDMFDTTNTVNKPQAWYDIHIYLVGDDNHICLLGVCLFIT